VKSREKRFRRRKLMMTVKSRESIDKNKFLDCSRVSGNKDVFLHGHCILDTLQRKHIHSEFNNIHGPITMRDDGKTDESELRGSQNHQNYVAEDDSVFTENLEVWNESKGSELSVVECSIEADIPVEKECSGIHGEKIIKASPQETGKVVNEHGQRRRKSENMETKAFFPKFSDNVLRRSEPMFLKRREQKCNIEVKKEIPVVVTSAEPLIETETSLDVSLDNAAICHHNDVPQVNFTLQSCVSFCCAQHFIDLIQGLPI
jgi:hypothetical protein